MKSRSDELTNDSPAYLVLPRLRQLFRWNRWARDVNASLRPSSQFRQWTEEDWKWYADERPCDGFASGLD